MRKKKFKSSTTMVNKTPVMQQDTFRLQLANNRHLIENLPPPRPLGGDKRHGL